MVLIVVRVRLGELLRVRLADEGELGNKVVAENGQQLRLQPVIGQLFHVHIMVGEAVMLEGQIRRVAPAVHFAGEEGDALRGVGRADEGGEIGGQRREGELVDAPVTFIVPRLREGRAELKEREEAEGESRYSFHICYAMSAAV